MKLKKINLKKGHEHKHPDIVANGKTPYLVKYNNEWFAGTFDKEWFGIRFNGGYYTSLQFDTPGFNRSRWQEVHLIME